MAMRQPHLSGECVELGAITRGSWFAAALAAVALAVGSPLPTWAAGDDDSASFVSVSQPGSRALRTIDPMPHEGVPGAAEPDVWCVSTRRLPDTCHVPLAPNLAVERFVDPAEPRACGRWERSDLAGLLGGDGKPLMIFIHGNRYDSASAKQQGLLLARHCVAACPQAGPVRTVIFSWPSEQQGILLKDGRAKYERAFTEGRYIAWLLGQIEPARPVSIVAYSFGSMITLEGLKNLIAVERAGRNDLQSWIMRPGQTNLVFIAPAVRCDAFAPRGRYRHTLDCVDQVSLIINSQDDALRFFPLIDRDIDAEARGYVGMPRRWIPGHVEFAAIDGANIIGRQHGLPLYLASPALTKWLCTAANCGLNPE